MNRCVIGDCREVLRQKIADGVKVQMCVTSPPYWGLRDYGVAGQIGLESTPEKYVATMVEVFRLVREVLADDGTLWLNLGDSYAAGAGSVGNSPGGGKQGDRWKGGPPSSKSTLRGNGHVGGGPKLKSLAPVAMGPMTQPNRMPIAGLKPKDLCGIPWRVAFALQADGWYLRSDIIWAKPNPMPESAKDRPTKSHEYLFLLTKGPRYFYDADAVKEPQNVEKTIRELERQRRVQAAGTLKTPKEVFSTEKWRGGENYDPTLGRNRRTVWTIATAPFKGAHFATFPPKLVEPCILAGSSEKGHCPQCGARWVRVVKREPDNRVPYKTVGTGPKAVTSRNDGNGRQKVLREDGKGGDLSTRRSITLGFRPTCAHNLEPVPDVVLDPFLGSGVTAEVAQHLGRGWIGIDLNPSYTPMQQRRTAQTAFTLAAFA